MAKKKKLLKKLAKAALIGGALYGASKLAKGAKRKVNIGSEDLTHNIPPIKNIEDVHSGLRTNRYKFDTDHLTSGTYAAKGGRIGKKDGGRTGKQFGGGLGSTARRDMRSGYYPNDMGMRGGTMYKKGGRVKSMGIAKRGGGIAKR